MKNIIQQGPIEQIKYISDPAFVQSNVQAAYLIEDYQRAFFLHDKVVAICQLMDALVKIDHENKIFMFANDIAHGYMSLQGAASVFIEKITILSIFFIYHTRNRCWKTCRQEKKAFIYINTCIYLHCRSTQCIVIISNIIV